MWSDGCAYTTARLQGLKKGEEFECDAGVKTTGSSKSQRLSFLSTLFSL